MHAAPRLTVPDSVSGRAFSSLFGGAAEITLFDDFLTVAWRKLCGNAVGGLMTLTGRTAVTYREPGVYDAALRLAEECAAVGRAVGASLPPGFAAEVADAYARQPPERGSSILTDRIAGRALEWDARNGVICRLGDRHGIPTPVSDVIVPLLAASGAAGGS